MLTRSELAKYSEDLFILEERAFEHYNRCLEVIKDENDASVVNQIRKDEERHMGIAKRIIAVAKMK